MSNWGNCNIDLGKVKSGDYLPVGSHGVFIYDAEGPDSDQSGKLYATLVFKAITGQIHKERYYLNEESLWKLKNLAVAAGIPANATINPGTLVGKKVTINLTKREYNGKSYTNINRVEPCADDIQAPWPAPEPAGEINYDDPEHDPF